MIRSVLGSRASIGGVLGSGRGGAGNGLLTGLVAYWALDEAGGANNALDKHSSGLTLTQYNSPGADTGKVYATARTFNGSSQYFGRTSETALQTGDIDYSVAMWVYLSGVASLQVFAGKDALASQGREWIVGFRTFTNRIFYQAAYNDSSTVVVDATTFGLPPTGQWILVCAWHDSVANTLNISVNNGSVDSQATTGGLQTANYDFMIGRRHYSTSPAYTAGRIGPVMFWKNRTLDATARAALYNGGAGLAYSAFTA